MTIFSLERECVCMPCARERVCVGAPMQHDQQRLWVVNVEKIGGIWLHLGDKVLAI